MSASLAHYLKDFGDPQPQHNAQSALMDFSAGEYAPTMDMAFPDFEEAPVANPEAIREEAHARGRQEATAELQALHQEELAALVEAHRIQLEELRQAYEEQAANQIATGLRTIAVGLSEEISSHVADCLAPFLQEEIANNAVATMAGLVREAILSGEAATIIVKGPLPLFNILATELGEDAGLLRHSEAADLDLTVEIAGSVLVTRMSAFAASLKKVLE